MDVLGWITADLASLRGKLTTSVIDLVPVARWADQADGGGSSINHLLLHLARHHDLAITTAIRNKPPLFSGHAGELGLADAPPTVGLAEREEREYTTGLPAAALRAFVDAVFDGTERWLGKVASMALDTHPDVTRRLATLAEASADEVPWLHRMWGDQTVGWLVQWPVIGHGHAHVGEAISVRNRLGYSPF